MKLNYFHRLVYISSEKLRQEQKALSLCNYLHAVVGLGFNAFTLQISSHTPPPLRNTVSSQAGPRYMINISQLDSKS